ncbi:hypothetical protein AVEN_180211-1 [Araneus ventricosus]|uniref:Uncharacterized protein n=1 Tax=Araneus ventricosus TaxID=182803 RepID=A0A4Y2HPM4_ARAVE|nr:hypothetical protein AVEN_180211-1 [Araneus ventricosus]
MDISNADKEIMADLLSKFEISPQSFDCLEDDQVFKKLKKPFSDIIERLKATRENVSSLSSVLGTCNFSIQTEHVVDRNLHFNCVKAMIPMFYETGQDRW